MTKILLVEDDKSLREIYGVRLLAEGYDIVSAGDGEEALAMAIKDRPDLIVSDVMMPKISGFDMLDILRSTTETKGIKVIMMTALSSEEQRERGVALGADRYLVKSQVGIEDVVRTVHEVLGDAPVSGQTPLMASVPSAAPVAAPSAPVVSAAPSVPGTPFAPGPGAVDGSTPAPAPSPPAAPVAPVAPMPMPMPTPLAPSAPTAPVFNDPTPVAPTPVASPASRLPNSVLPEPTAPFSTPRNGTLASRVIQPIETADSTPDFTNLMDQELSAAQQPANPAPDAATEPNPSAVGGDTPAPTASSMPPAAPAPFTPSAPATPAGLGFEETPRPSAAPVAQSTPPIPPVPNTGL